MGGPGAFVPLKIMKTEENGEAPSAKPTSPKWRTSNTLISVCVVMFAIETNLLAIVNYDRLDSLRLRVR